MKKEIKIITAVLLAFVILATISTSAFGISGTLQALKDGKEDVSGISGIQNLGASLVTIIQVVGVVLAVVILSVLGIKYMMGSAEEKAEYKKTMIPYVIGAVLLFGASAIAGVIVNIANGMASTLS